MADKEKKAAEKAPEKAAEEKPAEEKKAKKAKNVKVVIEGNEINGVCVAKRKINGGSQVFLKIKGQVNRWVNTEDIVK